MRKSAVLAVLAAALVAAVGFGLFEDAVAAAGKKIAAVREQNVDATGAIRVHEQGTAKVDVTNDAIQVTGDVGVTGTVAVGNVPTVKLDPSSPVTVAAPARETALLPGFDGFFIDVPATGILFLETNVAVADYDAVRVSASNQGPGTVTISLVHALGPAAVTPLDQIVLAPGESTSELYEAPGTELNVSATSNGQPARIWLLAYGR